MATGEWMTLAAPLIRKAEVGAAFGETVFNAAGSRALADLLRRMAMALDERIAQDERDQERRATAFNR